MNPKSASSSGSDGTTNPSPIQKSKRPKCTHLLEDDTDTALFTFNPIRMGKGLDDNYSKFTQQELPCLQTNTNSCLGYNHTCNIYCSCFYSGWACLLQNMYVKSRSDKQLRMKAAERQTDPACNPEGTTSNGSPIVPCGLIAWSLFNDTYKFSLKSKVLEVSKKNIAWKSDQERKFGSDVYPKNFQSEGLIGGAKLNNNIPNSWKSGVFIME